MRLVVELVGHILTFGATDDYHGPEARGRGPDTEPRVALTDDALLELLVRARNGDDPTVLMAELLVEAGRP